MLTGTLVLKILRMGCTEPFVKTFAHQIIRHFLYPRTKNIIQVQNEKRKLETELEDVQKAKSELIQEAQSLESELFTLRWVVFVKI